ncbi:MAG: polyribonucleotide nucleotidyltransferase [Armatimonadetes bacterium]|nr:polyribonucleotide nucleotidyltransferase [Armatimonadota bacterium]
MTKKTEFELGGRTITLETGNVAKQANGGVLLTCGETVVLGAATMSLEPREGMDFFPLTCDYEERKYAVGKIPGGFVKRGGRPSEKAILTSRLIDRPLRPLFPNGMRNDVQVITIPLSMEPDNPADTLALVAASAALTVSDIPFSGPVGAVRVGRIDEQFIINPSLDQQEESDLDLIVAGTREAVMMLEGGADELAEAVILEAIDFGFEAIKNICAAQEELAESVGAVKTEVSLHEIDAEILAAVRETATDDIAAAIQDPDKASRESGINDVKLDVVERLADQFPERELEVAEAAEKVVKEQVRKLILDKGVRPDGRAPEQIRDIRCDVGLLPRVHGSGLFTRGQTQVLTSLTLGSLDDAQIVDTLDEDGEKRYMHFYNFLPFSTGETRPLRAAGRREVGHGALAERALRYVVPPQEEFPYTLLLMSEVLESNGSTSMASVCGSTLALMDAGVKVRTPIAGIAMGLMTDADRYAILSDIQGMEDFTGDMDFKVAGSAEGITAIQMDTKISGISHEVVRQTLSRAREGRLHILGIMLQTIPEPRPALSRYAPRVFVIEIHPDKIGDVIGPGGKIIKKIEADTGAKLDIQQDGHIYITSVDADGGERALKIVEDLTRDVKLGETYLGRVTRVENYGAFVEILPGREGMVHISEMAVGRVARVEDVVRIGDEVLVKVVPGEEGKIRLSMKGLTQKPRPGETEDELQSRLAAAQAPRPEGERDRGGDRGRDRGRGGGFGRRDRDREENTPGEVRAHFRPKR